MTCRIRAAAPRAAWAMPLRTAHCREGEFDEAN